MPELRITRRAKRDLAALPPTVRDAVSETIALVALQPESMGKPLVGRLAGIWSARVGNYRVLYTIEETGVIVRTVRHRAVAYRRRRRSR